MIDEKTDIIKRPYLLLSELSPTERDELTRTLLRRRRYVWQLYLLSVVVPIAGMITTVSFFVPEDANGFWPGLLEAIFPFLDETFLEMRENYGLVVFEKSVVPISSLFVYSFICWFLTALLFLYKERSTKVSGFLFSRVFFKEDDFEKGFLHSTFTKGTYDGRGRLLLYNWLLIFPLVFCILVAYYVSEVISLPALGVISVDPVDLDIGLSFMGKLAPFICAGLILPGFLQFYFTHSPRFKLVGLTDEEFNRILEGNSDV
ncbi:MAG: hypothetical protein AAGJ34_09605 [Pseudomonadota bacterium]